jgi:hypothetical protein
MLDTAKTSAGFTGVYSDQSSSNADQPWTRSIFIHIHIHIHAIDQNTLNMEERWIEGCKLHSLLFSLENRFGI